MQNELAPWQLFLKLYQIGIFFYLDIRNGHFTEGTGYLVQLVLVTVLICRKEAQNKRKQFSLDRKSLSASGNKVFRQKNGFSLISVTVSTCRKKIK